MIRSASLQSLWWKIDTEQIDDALKINFDMVDISFWKNLFQKEEENIYWLLNVSLFVIFEPRRKIREYRLHNIQ